MVQDNILRGATKALPNPEQSIGEIFFNALKASSSKTALVDALTNEKFTASEVLSKSIQVAIKLRKLGVEHGDMVGIISENRTDYIFCLLGCFFVGAPMNLLNPDYVSREILHAFSISQPRFVISSPAKRQDVTDAMASVNYIEKLVNIEDLTEKLCVAENELAELEKKFKVATGRDFDTKEQLAIVLCSSGTTGFPKGVAITHEIFKYYLPYFADKHSFNIGPDETLIAMLPFYHIFGFITAVSCFIFGAKTVVLSKFKPETFLKTIETHKITKLFLVPPLVLFLAKSPLTNNYNLSSINDMICAAAPLGAETQQALEEKIGIPLRQAYGLTETCAVSLTPPNERRFPGNSGKILVNVIAKFVDIETNKIVGANTPGEICIKAPTIMKCYLGNEKATKDMFDEDGYLHTGDIGYFNEEGFIFIVDRLKELIKYKGFQVPPAELEDILISHDDISDAAVIGIKDERAGEKPKAYVVKRDDSALTKEDVINFVAKHVSIQKQLHGGVEFIDKIPKSAAGKILRRELRKLAGQ